MMGWWEMTTRDVYMRYEWTRGMHYSRVALTTHSFILLDLVWIPWFSVCSYIANLISRWLFRNEFLWFSLLLFRLVIDISSPGYSTARELS